MARKTGCPLSPKLIIISSATRFHFPPGLSLLVEYHFVSVPDPRNDQRPAGNLFAKKDASVELAIHSVSLSCVHHMMSLNTDMKIIRPLKLCWVAHFVHELLDFLDELQCSESWEIFHSNSIGSPSIVSKILYCDESLNQSDCCSQAVFDVGF